MLEEIPLHQLHLSQNETQCLRRETFDPVALDELANSVARHGVLQPIVVRRIKANDVRPDNDKLMIVAGERRYLAAKKAGLETIPAVVREMSDEDVIEVQLVENLQRADLDPLQEAEGYRELIDNYGHPVDEIHARIGKSRAYVYKRLQLLQLSKKCRGALIKSEISVGLALLIARIPNVKCQDEALRDFTISDERPTLSAAAQDIRDNYMLSLADAPFPTDDPDLVRNAPVCAQCPKRTGNQSELFDDIAGKDLCTDPECFKAKKTNHNKRMAKQWKAEGRPVIEGKKAKEVMPWGLYSLRGYEKLDSSTYAGGKSRKVRQLVKDDLDKVELLITPAGDAVEVIPDKVVRKAERALNKTAKSTPKGEDPAKAAERRRAEENAFRLELYREVRQELQARDDTAFLPTLEEIAIAATERLWHDYRKLLCKFHGLEPVKKKTSWGAMPPDYDKPLAKRIQQNSEDPRLAFLDVLIVSELKSSGDRQSYPRLKKLATAVGVDPKAVKRRLKAEATAKARAQRAVERATAKVKQKAKPKAKKKKAPAKKKKDLDPFVHGTVEAAGE